MLPPSLLEDAIHLISPSISPFLSVSTMPIVRRVRPTDLLSLNLCNLDSYTENYDLNFYLTYLMKWPSLFQCVEEDGGKIVAYSLS